jgi:hypothetical protein
LRRATSIVWLDFGLDTFWGREWGQTLRGGLSGEQLHAGSHEIRFRTGDEADIFLRDLARRRGVA